MRISEKKMMMQAISTIAVIVGCLAAMTITAYAYFTHSVTSGFYPVRTANFETSLSIQITDDAGNVTNVVSNTENNKMHEAFLEGGKTYTIAITQTTSSTAKTGFVIMSAAGSTDVYHTVQLGMDATAENGFTREIKFYVAPTLDTTVVFLSHWGTSSCYGYSNVDNEFYITKEKLVNLVIDETMGEELLPTPTPFPEITPTPLPEATATPLPGATDTPAETAAPEATVAPSMPPADATMAPELAETPVMEPSATTAPAESGSTEPSTEPSTDAPADEPVNPPVDTPADQPADTAGEQSVATVSEE